MEKEMDLLERKKNYERAWKNRQDMLAAKVLEGIKVEGVKVFDPRDNTWKVSDNPALILKDLIDKGMIIVGNEPSDEIIGKLASYYEELINGTSSCEE